VNSRHRVEHVDKVLESVEKRLLLPTHYETVLAAEVRALRLEVEEAKRRCSQCGFACSDKDGDAAENERLRTQLADLQRRLDVCRFGGENAAAEFNRRGELNAQYEAKFSRVEALCDMQHDDRLIRVGDIRAALRGET